ncbi:MAG: CapA family protein [Sphingomonadales bacterium]|nr:MAG: CapA family protein [Sphingomonadales bacterium]
MIQATGHKNFAARAISWAAPARVMRAVLPALALCAANASQVAAQEVPLEVAPVPSTPVPDGFTLAAAGDIIYLRPMLATLERDAPTLLALLRNADATFGNFETSVFDINGFTGSPQAESGGTWMMAEPAIAAEVKAMGFDIVSHANNHATDWGVEGLYETLRHLDAAGLRRAGSGRSLAAARAPGYLDLPLGRVALVAATSTFPAMSRGADPLGEVPGRPGVNAIRTVRSGLVSPDNLRALRQIAGAAEDKPVTLMGTRYISRPDAGPGVTFSYEINRGDERANVIAVRQAHQNANLAIFSLHNHEPGNASETPADFAVPLAHNMIDAGADVVIGHGPHQLRGIEIYKGKPIFYSLGNFAMMNNSLDIAPADMYDQYGVAPGSATTPELLQARNARIFSDPRLYEGAIAVMRFTGGKVSEIRLHPVDLGVGATGAARGVPRAADPQVAQRILERLARLSKPFGTDIRIEKGVGVIRVAPPQGVK